MKTLYLVLIFLCFTKRDFSQSTYTFNGNGNWTLASNWAGNLVPPDTLLNGSDIYISPTSGGICTLNKAQTIGAGAYLIVTTGAQFINPGNLIIRNGNLNNSDSIYLISYVDVDTTRIAGQDTITLATYTYDSLHRIIQKNIAVYGYGYSNNYLLTEIYHTRIYYHLTDSLPYEEVRNDTNFIDNYYVADSSYFNYLSGKIVYDSVITNYGYSTVHKYQYDSNKIYLETVSYQYNPVHQSVDTIYITKLNGNTIHEQADTTGNCPTNFTFSYDNYRNPFYRAPPSSESPVYYGNEFYSEDLVYEKNNPVDIHEPSCESDFHYQYAYEYNLLGYPTIARVTNMQSTHFAYLRYFKYSNLR